MAQLQTATDDGLAAWPHILVLEDERSVAEGLQMILSEDGYSVDLELTGREALNTFRQKTHDLLIADLKLPDIDGMEVIRQVKHDSPDTGVIIITGYSTVPSAIKAMKLGVHDYLPKPFTEEEILAAVKSTLEAVKIPETEPMMVLPDEKPPALSIELVTESQVKVNAIMAEVGKEFSGKADEVIPLLQMVQDRLGYLPGNALEAISRITKQPAASIFGIATFYEQFRLKPVGKHIVKVCRGTACHVKGADRILNEITSNFHIAPGQTSDDRLLTLETVACFGSCAIAPVVVVDQDVKGRMNSSKTSKMLDQIEDDEPHKTRT